MKSFALFAVGFSLLICLMVGCMQIVGLAHPNLADNETLLQFYCTLFFYTFIAFPLTGLVIACSAWVVDIATKSR